jgi:hypothetical protein
VSQVHKQTSRLTRASLLKNPIKQSSSTRRPLFLPANHLRERPTTAHYQSSVVLPRIRLPGQVHARSRSTTSRLTSTPVLPRPPVRVVPPTKPHRGRHRGRTSRQRSAVDPARTEPVARGVRYSPPLPLLIFHTYRGPSPCHGRRAVRGEPASGARRTPPPSRSSARCAPCSTSRRSRRSRTPCSRWTSAVASGWIIARRSRACVGAWPLGTRGHRA